MKIKNILIVFAFFLFIFQIWTILPTQHEELFSELIKNSNGNVEWETSGDGKIVTVLFTDSLLDVETFVEIGGEKFGNVVPADKSVIDSYIKVDKTGKIIELDLTVNEKGATYIINGIPVEVPPNGRVRYENGVLYPSKGSKIDRFKTDQLIKIKGPGINFFDEVFVDGEVSIDKKGILVKGGEVNYKKMEIKVDKNSGDILIANLDTDLSGYKGNWIRQNLVVPSGQTILEMKSSEKGVINVEILEGNEIFDTTERDFLEFVTKNGDGLLAEKREDLPPLVTHKSSENGKTFIKNGDLRKIEFNKKGIFFAEMKSGEVLIPSETDIKEIALDIESDSENIDSMLKIRPNKLSVSKDGKEIIIYGYGCCDGEGNEIKFSRGGKINIKDIRTTGIKLKQKKDTYPVLIDFLACINRLTYEENREELLVTSFTDDDIYDTKNCDLNNPQEKYQDDSNCIHKKDSCHYYGGGDDLNSRAADMVADSIKGVNKNIIKVIISSYEACGKEFLKKFDNEFCAELIDESAGGSPHIHLQVDCGCAENKEKIRSFSI